jgi:hypothetical protein
MNLGIDKIALTTQDFSVKEINQDIFGLNRNTKPGSKALPIYSDEAGNKVEANNYYHNSKTANYSINKYGLNIGFNPSHLYHKYNLIGTGDKLNNAFKIISNDLKNIGINANLFDMKPTRLDYAKQSTMNHPVLLYSDAFRNLKGKRQSKKEEPHSYYFTNKQHQACFYNKTQQLIDVFGKGSDILVPPNMMRAEVRALSSKSVKGQFSIHSVSDILNLDDNTIKTIHSQYLKNQIFDSSKRASQLMMDFETEIKQYQHTKKLMPRGYLKHFLAINGINGLLEKFGGMDGIVLFLKEAGESRKTVNKHINYIKDLTLERAYNSRFAEEITTDTLLNELMLKFAA